MKMDLDRFGKSIKNYRIRLNLTQEDLAERAGISVPFLGGIETGKRVPSVITIVAILNALNISYDECMKENLGENDLFYKSILLKYHSSNLTFKSKQFLINMFSDINKRWN